MANNATPAVVLSLLCAGATFAYAEEPQFGPYELERASVGVYDYPAVATESSTAVAKPVEVATPRAGRVAVAGVPGRNSKPLDGVDAVKAPVVPQKISHQLK